MMKYMAEGGSFMLPLTILAALAVVISIKKGIDVYLKEEAPAREEKGWINAVLQIGVFCFFLGILSQAVGLYQALGAIIAAGDVSPALIYGGLRVSFIAPIYGLLILLFSLAFWSVLTNRFDSLVE